MTELPSYEFVFGVVDECRLEARFCDVRIVQDGEVHDFVRLTLDQLTSRTGERTGGRKLSLKNKMSVREAFAEALMEKQRPQSSVVQNSATDTVPTSDTQASPKTEPVPQQSLASSDA